MECLPVLRQASRNDLFRLEIVLAAFLVVGDDTEDALELCLGGCTFHGGKNGRDIGIANIKGLILEEWLGILRTILVCWMGNVCNPSPKE